MANPERWDHPDQSGQPDDAFLIRSMLGGDMAALRKLMDRYDRLVRYTIFRSSRSYCDQDPQWLDAVASMTWMGFVRSMRRSPEEAPRSVSAFLVQIARRQAATAARAGASRVGIEAVSDIDGESLPAEDAEASAVASGLEQLEALRACLEALEPDDRTLLTQLPAITDRRWRDAASALGLQESTLRSRWKRLLEKLKFRLSRGAARETLAPGGSGRD